MDITIIGTAFSHLKTSMDIAKLISDSASSLGEAETKLKLAELISSLADLKMELADIKVDLIDKDDVIRELKNKIEEKESLIFDGKLYWKENDKIPFCTVCKEKDGKYHHLTYYKRSEYSSEHYQCKVCRNCYYI
ncbi:hypothetical protein ACOTWK_01885 [Aliarcobacter butzleri]|uniref:Uncharacterized protein n=1 Tax=Arcobacter lacus TaxID=1912876 RepID=A0ABX5JLL6_9BACT|nr:MULTISPECIES: hypothetical protein [Arcobacteraceae]MCG3655808.1 hypothetical protein [Aliarcobacter butzleri]MDK2051174.1 hypothetical protein [Aliarcobacter butzleri]PUE67648.1 hypothetical protein B0175_01290 [Arcobacter lacus]